MTPYLTTPCIHCGTVELFPPALDYTADQGADGYLSTVTAYCDNCEERTPTDDLNAVDQDFLAARERRAFG